MCTTLYSTHYIITIKGTLRNTLCIKSVYRIDGKTEEIYNGENRCFRTQYRKTLKLVRPAGVRSTEQSVAYTVCGTTYRMRFTYKE